MRRPRRGHLIGLLTAVLLVASTTTANAAKTGIYQVWGDRHDVATRSYVHGGQIVLEWKSVETARGHFDWSSLRAQLNAFHAMHKAATVQINSTTTKPLWLWKIIARCGRTQGQDIPQYWDPLYLTVQRELLASLSKALKGYPHRGTIALVRANPNAIGTELTAVPAGAVCTAAGNGHKVSTPWSKTLQKDYYRGIMGAYRSALSPAIHVALRADVFTIANAPLSWLGRRDAWIMGTASDIDPNPTRDALDVLATRLDNAGRTNGYWEPISDVGKRNLVSWNYWRILLELHKGVSYIAVYGNEIRQGSNPQFRAAFQFANRYAGSQHHPRTAPGAFIALRQGTGRMAGDLRRFMTQVSPGTTSIALDSRNGAAMIGPATQRFGRFARKIVGGTTRHEMFFRLNRSFKRGVEGRRVRLQVLYLDRGRGSFQLRWGRRSSHQRTVRLHGSGSWRQVTARISHARFRTLFAHRSDLVLKALGRTAAVFHMVEVRVPGR
jgi:hypothetical protein